MELARVLLLQETLGATSLAGVPTELGSSTKARLLAGDEILPSGVDERLVEQAVDYSRVHPVVLGEAGFKMTSNVLDVTFAGWMQGRAETTSPKLALAQELDHLFGVGTCRATMALLVMLVERVGAPKAAIAARFRARVFPPALVKLVLMSLPIILALEARVARCAPVYILLIRHGWGSTHNLRAINHRCGSCARCGKHGEGSLSASAGRGLPRHGRASRANRPQ